MPAWAQRLGPGWHALPAPPAAFNAGDPVDVVLTDTGQQLFVWGAGDRRIAGQRGTAAVLDLNTKTWMVIEAPPITSSVGRGSVWTGTQVVVWSSAGAARWVPGGGWIQTAKPPTAMTYGGSYRHDEGIWTGTDLLFWAGGLAYTPATDTWRQIAPVPHLPARATAAYTGQMVVVMGMYQDSSPVTLTDTHEVDFAYNPATDTWTDVAQSKLTPNSFSITRFGDTLIAADYTLNAVAYDVSKNTWNPLPPVPLAMGQYDIQLFSSGQYAYANYGGAVAVLDPTRQWTPLPAVGRIMTASGGAVFAWTDQPVVLVPPSPNARGALPPPKNLLLGFWRLNLAEAINITRLVSSRPSPTGNPVRIEIDTRSAGGACELVSSASAPLWWNRRDLTKTPIPGMGRLPDSEKATVRSGLIDNRNHLAIVSQDLYYVVEVTCDSLIDTASIDKALSIQTDSVDPITSPWG